MGMAASQARLLFITARLHDVELRAQQLLAQKIALATQQDAAWSKYNEAMDASVVTANTINMQNGSGQTTVASFNSLTRPDTFSNEGYGMRFGVVDTTDVNNPTLYLSGVNHKKYQEYIATKGQGGGDAGSFAMYMMGLSDKGSAEAIKAQEQAVFESERNTQLTELGDELLDDLIEADYANGTNEVNAHNQYIDENVFGPDYAAWEAEYAAWLGKDENERGEAPVEPQKTDAKYDYWDDYEEKDFGGNVHDAYDNAKLTEPEKEPFKQRMEEFSKLAQASFNEENYKAIVGEDAFDSKMYDYYSDMWHQIQEVGGRTKAMDSNNADNEAWLTEQVKRGNVQIWLFEPEGDLYGEEKFNFEADSPSSSSSLSYTPTTEIDKEAQKKAEAEYEYTLKQIDNKEKKIDIELSKLETERNALTTEYDSVKKVIEDNVERTFGIFS